METAMNTETSVKFHQTRRRNVPHTRRRGTLKPNDILKATQHATDWDCWLVHIRFESEITDRKIAKS